jgi:hypothetical protein
MQMDYKCMKRQRCSLLLLGRVGHTCTLMHHSSFSFISFVLYLSGVMSVKRKLIGASLHAVLCEYNNK